MVKFALIAGLLIVAGCQSADQNSTQNPAQIPQPSELLQLRAVDRDLLLLEVSINGSLVESARDQVGDTWSVIVNADANSQNTLNIRWLEQLEPTPLLLAIRDVTFMAGSTGQTLTLDDNYVTTGQGLDADNDGISNMAERLAGSDPFVADFEQVELTEPDMVPIQAGCFQMGSPESEEGRIFNEMLHEVCVDAFSLGAHELTRDEYRVYAQATNRDLPDIDFELSGNRPMVGISWIDATLYAAWLSNQTGRNYRLPTEAEWEYAARAGSTTPFNTGELITTSQANFDGRIPLYGASEGTFIGADIIVGSFAPNAFGLYDMHGNVAEWTCTQRIVDYDGGELLCHDDTSVEFRAIRGGNFESTADNIRSANRENERITSSTLKIGIRLARD